MRNNSKLHYFGFTLLELIIALTIIGILTGIAYPLYNAHITNVRRTYATVALFDLATQLEQYYNQHHSYLDAPIKNNPIKFYQLKIKSADETSYSIAAAPSGPQAKADRKCGILSLDQLGNKIISGTGNVNACWGL